MNFGSQLPRGPPARPLRLPRAPPARGRASSIVGSTNLPEFGILPTTEPRHTGADAQPVGPRAHAGRLLRRLGGGGRRRDAAARPRQRRRRLDPHPGRLLRAGRPQAEPRPRLARARPRRLVPGLRRRARRARWPRPRQLLDVLAGYEVGDATWAPRPAEPYATVGAPRPRPPARGAVTAANPLERAGRPGVRARRCSVAAELLAALGHEVEEAAPALPGAVVAASCSSTPSARRSRSADQLRRAARRARRRRRTRSSRSRARSYELAHEHAVGRLPRRGRAAAGARARARRVLRRLRPAADAGAGRAAAARSASATGSASTRWRDLARSGRFTPYTRAVQRHRPAGDLGADRLRRRRPADRRAARRQAARRGHAAAGRRADGDRARRPGPVAPPTA